MYFVLNVAEDLFIIREKSYFSMSLNYFQSECYILLQFGIRRANKIETMYYNLILEVHI